VSLQTGFRAADRWKGVRCFGLNTSGKGCSGAGFCTMAREEAAVSSDRAQLCLGVEDYRLSSTCRRGIAGLKPLQPGFVDSPAHGVSRL